MTTELLLDTCAALWLMEDAAMTKDAVAAIQDAYEQQRPVHVSPFTAWEVGTLVKRGRISLTTTPANWFRRLASLDGIGLANLTSDILAASTDLPGMPPRDPADRIIIATARELNLTIVTRDRLIIDYAVEGHVSALTC